MPHARAKFFGSSVHSPAGAQAVRDARSRKTIRRRMVSPPNVWRQWRAKRVHCTPGLGGGRCGLKRFNARGAWARLVGAHDAKERLDVVIGSRKQ